MNGYSSLSHSRWACTYHVVFVPKGRKKQLYGKIREYLKSVFHELARQRGCTIPSGDENSKIVYRLGQYHGLETVTTMMQMCETARNSRDRILL